MEKLIEALNEDLSNELAAITQYMWHHVMAVGLSSPGPRSMFREFSIDEMKHAEALAERICYLGGTPTAKPTSIAVGGDLKGMIKTNLDAEVKAVKRYKRHIELARELGDHVTRRLLESLLADEEHHEDELRALLGE